MSYNKNMRVLVVDDFSTMRRIVRNILKQLGFNNVVEADDGSTACAAVRLSPDRGGIATWRSMRSSSGPDTLLR